ncbi:MAG: hypothetical protein ACXWD8_01835 [Mycobacterium sp.]
MTDIADTREQLDERRLELLRRKLAERGLKSSGEAAEGTGAGGMSGGQRRMWFVQVADPTGAILNICLSYRITGALDVARLRKSVNAVARFGPGRPVTCGSRRLMQDDVNRKSA